MKCPNCEHELTNIYVARNIELERDGENWIEKNVFCATASCRFCHEILDDKDISQLGGNIHDYI